MRLQDFPQRFRAKVRVEPSGCWVWTAGTNTLNPYPIYQLDGKRHYAHRLSWAWANDCEIPEGFHVHHKCGQPRCVNPEHLDAHSPEDHVEAHGGRWGGALINAAKTHCKYGHKFTDENTYVHSGQRKCRRCRSAAVARCKARKKAA